MTQGAIAAAIGCVAEHGERPGSVPSSQRHLLAAALLARVLNPCLTRVSVDPVGRPALAAPDLHASLALRYG
jgi:hypothetical protein